MKLCKQMPAVIAISLCLIANVMAADTWHLSKGKGWQKVSNDRESEYLLAVSRFKKAVISGQSRGIATEFAFLKDQFPELAGPDLDAFMVAESAYSKRKYDSALKHYDTFLNEFPDSWLYESALERKLAIATAYLNGQKRVVLGVLRLPAYDRGEKIIREIVDRAGQAPIARRALYVLAEAQKKNDKHLDEYETWAEISSKWPTGDTGKQSQFGMAYSLHSA